MLLSAGIFVWIEQRWSHWWVAVTQKKIDNLIAKHLSILPGDSFQPAIDGFIDTLTKDPGYIYNLNVSLPTHYSPYSPTTRLICKIFRSFPSDLSSPQIIFCPCLQTFGHTFDISWHSWPFPLDVDMGSVGVVIEQ